MSRLFTHFTLGAFLAYSLKDSTYELFRTKAVIPFVNRQKEEDYFGGALALSKGIFQSLYHIRAQNVGIQEAEKGALEAAKQAIAVSQQAVSAASVAVDLMAKEASAQTTSKKEEAIHNATQPTKSN